MRHCLINAVSDFYFAGAGFGVNWDENHAILVVARDAGYLHRAHLHVGHIAKADLNPVFLSDQHVGKILWRFCLAIGLQVDALGGTFCLSKGTNHIIASERRVDVVCIDA